MLKVLSTPSPLEILRTMKELLDARFLFAITHPRKPGRYVRFNNRYG